MLRLVPPLRAPAKPLRVAVLCSGRAPGLLELVQRAGGCIGHYRTAESSEPYCFVGCVTTDPDFADSDALEESGVPVLQHDIRGFYELVRQPLRDHQTRRAYDARTREMLRALRPDLVVLCGYLYVLTDVLLDAFPDRIVNVHDSDLAVLDEDGLPRYRGLHSTRDTVFAGEAETRSTVHLVERQVDVGPILVRSWPFPTHPMLAGAGAAGATDILKAYAYAQREWMMLESWPPLLDAAIQLFVDGRLRRVGGRLLVDGREHGIELPNPRDAVEATAIGAARALAGPDPIGAAGIAAERIAFARPRVAR